MGIPCDRCSLLIPSWDNHTTCVKCIFSAGLCSVDVHNPCEVCRSRSPVTWSRLRKSLRDARQKSTKRGTSHWSCQAPALLAWMESASTSSDLLSDNGSIADLDIREVDLELAAASAPTQVAEVSIHESSVVEPAIMTGQAPTMDIVSTVPLCGVLISGAYASHLGVMANQTSAPLLVAVPRFPPVTQGPINMLPGVSISHSRTPGIQIAMPALYSFIQSVSALPALYSGGYSIGAPPPAPPSAEHRNVAQRRIPAYDGHAVASAHSLCQSLCGPSTLAYVHA